MINSLLEGWSELPPWLRAIAALIVAGAGVAVCFVSGRLGGGLIGLGFALFCMSGPNDSEKNGYHF